MSNPVTEPPGWVDPAPDPHPVTVFGRKLNQRLDDLAEQSLYAMTEPEVRETLVALAAARTKLEALQRACQIPCVRA